MLTDKHLFTNLINFLIITVSIFSCFIVNAQCPDPSGLAGDDQVVCRGTSVTLGCNQQSDWCYKWYPDTAFPDLETTRLPNPTTLPLEEETEFTLVLSDGDGNVVFPLLTVTVFMDDIAVDLGDDQAICKGETVTLMATPSGANSYNYLWSTGETTQSIEVSPTETTDYTVEVEDVENGCKISDEVRVTVLASPFVEISASSPTLCLPYIGRPEGDKGESEEKVLSDCSNEKVLLYAGTGTGGYTYLWSTGETEPLIEVVIPDLYSVTVTESGGCSTVVSYEVESCVALELTPDVDQNGQSVLDAGAWHESYMWHDGSENQTIIVSGPGTYSVTVAQGGCASSAEVDIKEYEYDPNNIYLALNIFDASSNKRHIYICNTLGQTGILEEDRSKIEEIIKNKVDSWFKAETVPPFWTCAAEHSDQYPIDKSKLTAAMDEIRFFPFNIRKNPDGSFEYLRHFLDQSINDWAYYKFKLQIGAVESIIDIKDNPYYFPVNIADLPDQIEAILSVGNETGPSFQAPATTMNVTFKSTTTSNDVYTIYYNKVEAPSQVQVEENTFVELEIKKVEGTDHVPVDPASINISWRENGIFLSEYIGQNVILYKIPEYLVNGDPIPVVCRINGNTVDELNIVPTEMIIEPGYNIPEAQLLPEDSIPNAKKPKDYVDIALATIKDKNAAMYNQVIDGRQIEIILTKSTDKNHFKKILLKKGIPFGVASINLIIDNRIFIDPNKIEYSNQNKYKNCPVDVDNLPLYARITEGERDQIRDAIKDIGNPIIPPIVDQIKSIYPERGIILDNWCVLINASEAEQAIENMLEMYKNYELAYEPTISELSSMITLPEHGTIALAIDVLNDCRKWAQVYPPTNTVFSSQKNVVDFWYPRSQYHNGYAPPKKAVDELREKQYTKTIAHEIKHIQNKISDPINGAKWQILRSMEKNKKISSLELCYPYPCSVDSGHEHLNPDGISACAEEMNYKDNPKPEHTVFH